MLGLAAVVLFAAWAPRRASAADRDDTMDEYKARNKPRKRRRRSFVPDLALLMVACGACGGSDTKPPPVDAPVMIDAGCPMTCNALTGTGCSMTTKCAWLVDSALALHGSIGCSFAGAVAQGLPCTRDSGGGDNCTRGTTCYQDHCRAICGIGGGPPVCDAGLTCQSTEYFIPCGAPAPVAGLCLP